MVVFVTYLTLMHRNPYCDQITAHTVSLRSLRTLPKFTDDVQVTWSPLMCAFLELSVLPSRNLGAVQSKNGWFIFAPATHSWVF